MYQVLDFMAKIFCKIFKIDFYYIENQIYIYILLLLLKFIQ